MAATIDGEPAPIFLTQLTSTEQKLLVIVRDSMEKRSFWIQDSNKINIDQIYYKLCTYCMLTLHQNPLLSLTGFGKSVGLFLMFGVSFYNIDSFVDFLVKKISQSCDLYEVSINEYVMKAHYVTPISCEDQSLIPDAFLDALGISKEAGRESRELDLKDVLEPKILQSIRAQISTTIGRGILLDTPTNLLSKMLVGGRISSGETIYLNHIWKTHYSSGFESITDIADLITVYIKTQKNEDLMVKRWCEDTKQARAEQSINVTL